MSTHWKYGSSIWVIPDCTWEQVFFFFYSNSEYLQHMFLWKNNLWCNSNGYIFIKNLENFIWICLLSRAIHKLVWTLNDLMGSAMRKRVFRHMRTAKAQISLHICAVKSGPSLSASRIIGHYRMYEWRAKAQMIHCAYAG